MQSHIAKHFATEQQTIQYKNEIIDYREKISDLTNVLRTANEQIAEQVYEKSVKDAGTSFKEIQQSIDSGVYQIKEVTTAVEHMSTDSKAMFRFVENVKVVAENAAGNSQNVSSVTKEQLTAMREIFTASESLSQMADKLYAKIQVFEI